MIKRTGLLALLIAAAVFVSGCGTTSSGGGSSSLPKSTAATAVGYLVGSTIMTFSDVPIGTTSLAGISKKSGYSFDSEGWVSASYEASDPSFGSYSFDMKVRIYGLVTGLIDSSSKMDEFSSSGDELEEIWQYTTMDFDLTSPEAMSFNIVLGNSKSDPIKLENMTTVPSLTGPTRYSGSYGGDSFSVTMNYSGLSQNPSTGYPSGSVSFSVFVGSSPAYTGTLTFNGTSTATIVFSGGESYTLDLETGTVS